MNVIDMFGVMCLKFQASIAEQPLSPLGAWTSAVQEQTHCQDATCTLNNNRKSFVTRLTSCENSKLDNLINPPPQAPKPDDKTTTTSIGIRASSNMHD